ncbi:type II toxin-antitoxin system RelE/ParE family toxin [Lichenifustis flavocetrariae]|uniref:Toxin n=1 Tax=Lichenifustis flavocetrariae TaxID=2949735 RepID=A0AA41YST1_9HYPH|nr:type II toxin-antitoxin system RelE/ParE family toxin [Lichenifustis flavocetrariae]MCW6506660.1 type II toxin-antitoxin system RelE/ParE family toxin [Lichenifustis flavocetrariae]
MRGYRLSPLARTDLEHIWVHTFKNWSAEQADRYHQSIIAAIEGLLRGESVGRPVDIRAGYFKYAVGAHFVFFTLSDTSLDVIRILHQQMDVSRHL